MKATKFPFSQTRNETLHKQLPLPKISVRTYVANASSSIGNASGRVSAHEKKKVLYGGYNTYVLVPCAMVACTCGL